MIGSFDELSAYAVSKGGRIPTEPELRLFLDRFNVGYEGGANVGFRNWHPCPWVVHAALCTFAFANRRPERLPEEPSTADVGRTGGCGNGPQLRLGPMMASMERRSFRDTRQTSLIRTITLS